MNLGSNTGRNKVLIQANESTGRKVSQEFTVEYRPSGGLQISGFTKNALSIERYEKFEATFNILNSVSSNPYFPYYYNLSPAMKDVDRTGITVEGIFTSPTNKTYVQPGFYYQGYTRNAGNQTHIPSGNGVWKTRFSPQEIGNYTFQIRLIDDSGVATLTDGVNYQFTSIAQTNANNHGFLRVSPNDSRYFEFSDGTPFTGVGPGPQISGENSFQTDANLSQVGAGNSNLSRTWLSGDNMAGSSWAPWTGNIDYEGNFPGTSLTTAQAYGDGIFSLQLPQVNNSSKRCAFYGFQGIVPSVKTNTTYRTLVRFMTVDITGSGGFNLRIGNDWPSFCDNYTGTSIMTGGAVKGSNDWSVVTGSWSSGSNSSISRLLITLENVTGGQVYIDEISIREDLGGGNYGPEVLPRSKYNVQNYFTQQVGWNWDYGLDQKAAIGSYEKIVISEKQDFVFNSISPYGFGVQNGSFMGKMDGASGFYQKAYWRYLAGRYGYSRAVHSWEYANEQGTGSLIEANELAKFMSIHDAHNGMGTTSWWAGISSAGQFPWQNANYPYVDYADAHSYVNAGSDNTSWLYNDFPINSGNPFTFGSISFNSYNTLGTDSALYVLAHSVDAYRRNAAGNKPMIMGEAGIGYNNPTNIMAGDSDTDTAGVWLKQFIWSQMNEGGMYFLYWHDATIKTNNLYPLFGSYRKFMEGQAGDSVNKRIPFSNGDYVNANLTLPANTYGWGMKDITNGGAHFWLYDSNYNWTNISGGSALGNRTVSFTGLPTNTYTVEWWNTGTKSVSASVYSSQTLNHSTGTISLTVPSGYTGKDIAVKIFPQSTGYTTNTANTPSIQSPLPNMPVPDGSATPTPTSSPTLGPTETPSPTASPTPSPSPSPTTNPTPSVSPTTTTSPTNNPTSTTTINPSPTNKTKGDLNGDSKVNISDFSILAFYWNSNNTLGDVNGDGSVNITDLSILAFNWGKNL